MGYRLHDGQAILAPEIIMSISVSIVEDDAVSASDAIDRRILRLCLSRRTLQRGRSSARHFAKPAGCRVDGHQPARLSGIECVRRLKSALPKLQIVMLTVYEDGDRVFRSAEARRWRLSPETHAVRPNPGRHHRGPQRRGAHVELHCPKGRPVFQKRRRTSPELDQLTPREEILHQVAKGYHNKEIGVGFRSARRRRVHLKNIYEKLHVGSRSEAVAKFLRR